MTRILVILIALAIMQTVCEGAQEGTAGSGQRGIRFAPGSDGRQEGPVRSGGQAQKEADAEGPAGPGQPEREQQGGSGVPRRQRGPNK